jgi:ubiquinone/menaquinone biosynthesis C-methylase UbiE
MDNFTVCSHCHPDAAHGASRVSGRVYGVGKVAGDARLQNQVLEDLSDAHRYRRWLADLARPYLGEHPIEIGSGTGDYALEWVESVTSFTCTEAEEERYAALADRFASHDVIATSPLLLGEENLQWSRRPHTAAVAFNVFEHIPDDVAALRSLRSVVEPGGAVVLVVPAFPSAMSRFDLAVGHQRRYTKASLRAAFTAAGLRVEELRYINPVGLIAWYVAAKGLRMAPSNGPMLRLYDRLLVPVARAADRAGIAPFGQAVFGVARF